jgi:peroxiredoxin (alkyl hydroperoxide reductase subunit C)
METPLRPGQIVPEIEFETYDPATGEFRTFALGRQREAARWTVLLFYPADFTGL